jgi:hypothetical protein
VSQWGCRFSDANLTDTGKAVRYLCFLAVLLMLPVTATAQQRRSSGERGTAARQSEQSDERREKADNRRSERGDERRATSNGQNSFLAPIGLPPAIPNNRMPSWEQNRTPAWEQKQTPWWERQSQPSWERQQVHQPSWARDLKEAQDRRLGRPTPRSRRNQPAIVYVLPSYGYFPTNPIYGYGVSSSTTYVTPTPADIVTMYPPAEPPAAEITTGFLRLEVEPRGLLQVFVDGLFVGSLADLGSEIELRLGARRIELRAPGYRTLTFNTEIVPDRTIVYRGALEPVSNAPAASAAPSLAAPSAASPAPAAPGVVAPSAPPASRTIYVIRGCYMGNVAPKAADLKPGCDLSTLQKIEP